MTKTKAENASKKLNKNGIDADVRENYSGRGMFGAETYAVVINRASMVDVAIGCCPGLAKTRRDSMGLGAVFY